MLIDVMTHTAFAAASDYRSDPLWSTSCCPHLPGPQGAGLYPLKGRCSWVSRPLCGCYSDPHLCPPLDPLAGGLIMGLAHLLEHISRKPGGAPSQSPTKESADLWCCRWDVAQVQHGL